MNHIIRKMMQESFFDDELFAEKVCYNGKKILALVEIGEGEQTQSPSFMRSSNTTAVYSSAMFTVSLDDVSAPRRGDVILYDDRKYYVAGIELLDSVGGNVTVKATYNERGYLGR